MNFPEDMIAYLKKEIDSAEVYRKKADEKYKEFSYYKNNDELFWKQEVSYWAGFRNGLLKTLEQIDKTPTVYCEYQVEYNGVGFD
jgi:hypothetical protein